MNVTQPDTVKNEVDKGFEGIFGPYSFRPPYFPPFGRKIYEEPQWESEPAYSWIKIPGKKNIVEFLDSAISYIDEVLDVYDEDEIERLNTFSLCEDVIKSIWELREEANSNFVDVLVLLEVAVKNSHYRDYRKEQYESIKMVLEKLRDVNITDRQVKECRKILMDNGIDLFAPIRNWEDYKIEIKKKNAGD